MSHRIKQIESLLKRTISEVLTRNLSDPRVAGMVSVTKVELTSDLRNANVYVSVIPPQYQHRTMSGLQHAAGHIFSLVQKKVALRTVPQLKFQLDESLKKQGLLWEAIKRGMDRERAGAHLEED